ncbi:flagellar biosynthesis protein FlhB [Bartonella heixiaziensis]
MYIGNNVILLLIDNVFDILFSIFVFIFSFSLIYRYSGDSWKNSIKEAIKTFGWFFLLFLTFCFIYVAFKYIRY